MRRFLKFVAFATVLILAGILGLLFWPQPKLPELARNLPSNFEDAQEQFRARVAKAFALPLTEIEMIEQLTGQGFKVNETNQSAGVSHSRFPCQFFWRIQWAAQSGIVKEVNASYGAACL